MIGLGIEFNIALNKDTAISELNNKKPENLTVPLNLVQWKNGVDGVLKRRRYFYCGLHVHVQFLWFKSFTFRVYIYI